ncbi:sigma-70 family RNA polymerase sigma factor [Candidatus Uabimicrobium amorphum]|uniref:Uncharacterized protein n=1 Tax=Uabimicrobium amorphum TaxID=2596890 RepID=A0A5S9IRR9_UABAM|nr:sigma-70 family RNA polymerase sigma factor [Candidatus Uabimicrobium amorphum]BBM85970.1 hypothetical protein UABAM_04356 [Candidatus Uabimicrobium amorphum]
METTNRTKNFVLYCGGENLLLQEEFWFPIDDEYYFEAFPLEPEDLLEESDVISLRLLCELWGKDYDNAFAFDDIAQCANGGLLPYAMTEEDLCFDEGYEYIVYLPQEYTIQINFHDQLQCFLTHPSFPKKIELYCAGDMEFLWPAFRWQEVQNIIRCARYFSHVNGNLNRIFLLLLKMTSTCKEEAQELRQVTRQLCLDIGLFERPTLDTTVAKLTPLSRLKWRKHPQYGWLNNCSGSMRNLECSFVDRLWEKEKLFGALREFFCVMENYEHKPCVMSGHDYREVHQQLQSLCAEEKYLLHLRYIMFFTYEEMGDLLQEKPFTIYEHIQKIIAKIKRHLPLHGQ